MSTLTRAEQDRILAENGVTEIADDEIVVFDGDEFTIFKMVLKQPAPAEINRKARRAARAAERQRQQRRPT